MAKYDDLYRKYTGYVVLMLKEYMFVAYDESARVLSYLLEYKLFESANGLTACGPDKYKIMSILSAHHVNYLISEFGVISESNCFEDNCFYKYLSVSDIKPTEKSPNQNPTTTYSRKAAPSSQSKPERQTIDLIIPDWLSEGLSVLHKEYGAGVVQQIKINPTNIVMLVDFCDGPRAFFRFPEAFDSGILEKSKP